MRFKSTLVFSTACVLTLIIEAPPVVAQDTQAASFTEEFIVTARKREESLLRVPVVATAFNQEQLQLFQTHDLKSLATMVPGLSFGTSILSVGTQVSLRGVGTSALDPGVMRRSR